MCTFINAYPYFQMLNETNILSILGDILHIITRMIGKMLSMSIHSLKWFGLVIRGISKWTLPTWYGNPTIWPRARTGFLLPLLIPDPLHLLNWEGITSDYWDSGNPHYLTHGQDTIWQPWPSSVALGCSCVSERHWREFVKILSCYLNIRHQSGNPDP